VNLQSLQIVRELLLKAVEDGPVEMPAAIQKIFRELPSSAAAQSATLDTVSIENQVGEQFSTWGVIDGEQILAPEQAERWVNALRWVLQELRSWMPDAENAFLRLRILLAALAAFGAFNAEVDVSLQEFTTSPLPKALLRLLEKIEAQDVWANAGCISLWSEIQAVARAGDYERLSTLMRHFDIYVTPDIRLAIFLLWRMSPHLLASHIDQKQDALHSYVVCKVLQDSLHQFAFSVDDITFKFFSAAAVAGLRPESAPSWAVDVFCQLLLQVARSEHWASWLQAFFKYPHGNRVSELALPSALAQLEAKHWANFVDSVQLWTHLATVVPVANILVRFYKTVGSAAANEMWRLAYERWDKWDYGRELGRHMSAPAACSFDFPVAMYYALAPDEAKVEEERLIGAVESIEKTWFSSQTDLVTLRNRLLSRLRLVRHGQALASASGPTDPLPPPVQPDGDYAALRYQYFDVNSPTRNP